LHIDQVLLARDTKRFQKKMKNWMGGPPLYRATDKKNNTSSATANLEHHPSKNNSYSFLFFLLLFLFRLPQNETGEGK
jgi:hypothetical protein